MFSLSLERGKRDAARSSEMLIAVMVIFDTTSTRMTRSTS